MQINKHPLIYVLVLIFVLTGCKVRRPKEVIPESQMESLLYDYHIAKALGENLPYNENYKKALYVEYVFKKHGTTEAVFDSSMVWYTRNAKVLSKIYEQVNKKLKDQLNELDDLIAIRDNKPKISAPGDSIDVWLLERMLHITGSPLNNKLSFSIPSDSNFKARDTLQWNVHYHFLDLKPDSSEAALMAMAIQYSNDSVIGCSKTISVSGLQSIRLQANTLGDIKEVRGYIYYPGGKEVTKHLFANEISLIRYHSTDSLFSEKTDTVKQALPKIEEKKVEVIKQEEPAQLERVNPDELRRRGERPRPTQKIESKQEILIKDEPLPLEKAITRE